MTNRLRLSVIASVGAALLAIASPARSQASQAAAERYQPFPTVWTGVYTKAQAARGKQAYAQVCARCHRDDLTGGPAGPALKGSAFFDRWHDLKLLDVFAHLQSAMPHDRAVFVSADQARDIVTFLLQESGVPAGKEELSNDIDKLGQILVTRPPSK